MARRTRSERSRQETKRTSRSKGARATRRRTRKVELSLPGVRRQTTRKADREETHSRARVRGAGPKAGASTRRLGKAIDSRVKETEKALNRVGRALRGETRRKSTRSRR